jgi:MFS transporter, OFA family, oxalate/formate antiporter
LRDTPLRTSRSRRHFAPYNKQQICIAFSICETTEVDMGPSAENVAGPARKRPFLANPWLQLTLGIVGMVAIANLQYGWTLFVQPLHEKFGWSLYEIQVAFTLFVLAETWLVPIEGYFIDKFGPAVMVALGGVMIGLAWLLNAAAESLGVIYLAQAISGAGAGIVYGASIGNALKWFPRRRGLAAGLTAAAFGAGSALTVLPVTNTIRDHGYQAAFFWFGLGQGAIVLLAALMSRAPPDACREKHAPVSEGSGHEYDWVQVVRSPIFWLMYAMFVMVTMGGLMAIAQIGLMAVDYRVADEPVSLFGMTMAALPFAMALDRVLNGLTRPFFGWISDRLGRENTMFIAFGLEGIAIFLLVNLAHIPVLFVLITGLAFFAWGEIFSIFPALCGDLFGRKYITTNYGLLYTAKGLAAMLVPMGNWLKEATGDWTAIFMVAIAFDWLAALLALFVLKPMRVDWLRSSAETPKIQ